MNLKSCFAITRTALFAFLTGVLHFQAVAEPLTGREYLSRPPVEGGENIRYGNEPSQFAALWRPVTASKPPIVAIIHGGCWSKSYADLKMMNPISAYLQSRGIAVWNIEYRRTEESGGGWPGTYDDISAALGKLAEIAKEKNLDAERVVMLGYSAGGQLALMGAKNYKASQPTSLKLKGVITLGGLFDLKAQGAAIAAACGASEPMNKMLPPPEATGAISYEKASPVQALPLGFPVTLFQPVYDTYSPPHMGLSFVRAARAKGEMLNMHLLQDAGHFDMIAPDKPAWTEVVSEIVRMLNN